MKQDKFIYLKSALDEEEVGINILNVSYFKKFNDNETSLIMNNIMGSNTFSELRVLEKYEEVKKLISSSSL